MSEKRHKQYRKAKARTLAALVRLGLRGQKLVREMAKIFPRQFKRAQLRSLRQA